MHGAPKLIARKRAPTGWRQKNLRAPMGTMQGVVVASDFCVFCGHPV
jgi:hypothetical protein